MDIATIVGLIAAATFPMVGIGLPARPPTVPSKSETHRSALHKNTEFYSTPDPQAILTIYSDRLSCLSSLRFVTTEETETHLSMGWKVRS